MHRKEQSLLALAIMLGAMLMTSAATAQEAVINDTITSAGMVAVLQSDDATLHDKVVA